MGREKPAHARQVKQEVARVSVARALRIVYDRRSGAQRHLVAREPQPGAQVHVLVIKEVSCVAGGLLERNRRTRRGGSEALAAFGVIRLDVVF